ncbi:MAG TPA: hypothetical protein VFZ12_07230, partial [Dehalococcoidia bacterium]|nr:hypothetical protein [Dehalococcoidia bacterium]
IPTLVRSAAECIGVQSQLHDSEMEVYESWLNHSLRQDHDQQALDLPLGRYRAAGILAADEKLGAVYRFVSDVSGTPFGGSAFLTAAESNPQRVAVTFADQAFHAGYAELCLGWLLRLCERQLAYVQDANDVFNLPAVRSSEADAIRSQVESALSMPNRCRVEEQTIEGERRYLIFNFRRSPGGSPRRILL